MKRNIWKEGKTYLQHVHAWPFLRAMGFVRSELIAVSILVVSESRRQRGVVLGLIVTYWIAAYLIASETHMRWLTVILIDQITSVVLWL